MQNIKVSIVMAVYNGENVIRPTVDSILNQSFTNFEFIIVDDCSSDDTVKIIESYQDPRIVLIKNSVNSGQTKSLNTGLRAARGEYIARTDAGDTSYPQRLEKQVTFLEKNPDVAVLGTSAIRYNEEGRIIDVVHMPVTEIAIRQRLLVTTPVVHISVMMRKDVILLLGGYDDNFYVLADYELWSRLVIGGYKLANLKNVLAGYMISSESFGSRNAQGKSLDEACIISRNLASGLSGIEITLDQARNIRLMFDFAMYGMDVREIASAASLYSELQSRIGSSRRDSDYNLLRTNMKIILNNCCPKGIKNYILLSTFKKLHCLVSPKRIMEILFNLSSNLSWRIKLSQTRII